MNRKPRPSDSPAPPAAKLDIQRVRVNRDGYDSNGAYWGAGPDVFIATSADGTDEITVRARNVTDARQKVAAELARAPGTTPDVREPIAGMSRHKSRYEIEWRNVATGATVRIRITHARDYLSQGTHHIEVESLRPRKAPLPITETGYRSHFMSATELINAGGPVTFVTAWLERDAKDKAWITAATARAQGDLFQWADAQHEVGRKRNAKSTRPTAKPRKATKRDRSPG